VHGARDLAVFHAHGGRVDAARAVFGGDDWIDLSTGVAPWAWPVADPAAGLDRLPEPAAIAALEAAAAAAFATSDPAAVVAVPGTDLAMRLLAPILAAAAPAVLHPAYAGHRAAWPGATPLAAAQLDDLRPHDLIVLANPANPDGAVIDPARLRRLAEGRRLVVDEAYADPAPGLCPEASDQLIVLRSFGKFYGLPGLRLGFVIAGPGVTAQLRAVLGDWPISSSAVAIGTAAYRDAGWRAAQALRIADMGASLDRALRDAALPIAGSAPLFRLIACPDAAGLFRALAGHAILTRPFSDQPGRLRIGLPRDAAQLARLAAALEEFRR
jgi:cobalamin biosynthetic protein CobC